jgi:hypothetical protein
LEKPVLPKRLGVKDDEDEDDWEETNEGKSFELETCSDRDRRSADGGDCILFFFRLRTTYSTSH